MDHIASMISMSLILRQAAGRKLTLLEYHLRPEIATLLSFMRAHSMSLQGLMDRVESMISSRLVLVIKAGQVSLLLLGLHLARGTAMLQLFMRVPCLCSGVMTVHTGMTSTNSALKPVLGSKFRLLVRCPEQGTAPLRWWSEKDYASSVVMMAHGT